MTTLQTKPPFRSRHGSVAFDMLPSLQKRLQPRRRSKKGNTTRGSFGLEISRNRSASVATETLLKIKKSQSLPDGKIVLRAERTLSPNDVMDERRPKLRTARSLKAIDRRRELYMKFQLVAKMAIFCIREAKNHILRNKTYDDIGPYLNSLNFLEFEKDEDLLFDPNKFKANKQLRISEETKRILGKPWFERTPEELRYAQIALRNIQAYAEYPVRMQKKIVQVGRYEKYGSKRVVVRQGHPASAFYFILSGSVVVLVYQGDTKVAKPVAYMKRGQTFGELAIINRTTRQSTVVAKESLELLSLDIEDFHDIFMAGGVKNMTDPDHDDFLRGINIFHHWPIEKMSEHQDMCLFHYFKRGDVLVKDSHFSEWIVIVKSGSLSVLKKLKRVDAYNALKKEEEQLKLYKSEKQKRAERELRDKQRRYILSDLGIPLRNVEDVELEQVFTVPAQEIIESPSSRFYVRGLTSYSTDNFINPHLKSINPDAKLPHLNHHLSGGPRPKTSSSALINGTSSLLPRIQLNSHHQQPSGRVEKSAKKRSDNSGTGKIITLSSEASMMSKGSVKTESNGNGGKKVEYQDEVDILDELFENKNDIRTITHDLDSTYTKKRITILGYDPDDLTVADLDPQFVHIQTLTKGQVFGVAEIALGPQPSFCVVSNGAECIMLSRALYLQYASEALLRQLRQQCSPYPSDEDMQMKLKTTIDWDAFRSSTFQKTLHKLSDHRDLKKYSL